MDTFERAENFRDVLKAFERYWADDIQESPISVEPIDECIRPYISPLEEIHAQGIIVDYFQPHTCHCEDDNPCAGRAHISLVLNCEETATRLFARLRRIRDLYIYA